MEVGASAAWTVTTTLSAIDMAFPVNTGLSPFWVPPVAIPEPSTLAVSLFGIGLVLAWKAARSNRAALGNAVPLVSRIKPSRGAQVNGIVRQS